MWSCQLCKAQNRSAALVCERCQVPGSVITNPTGWWQCSNLNCCRFNSVDMRKCCFCDLSLSGTFPSGNGNAMVRDKAADTDQIQGGAAAGDSESEAHDQEWVTVWECQRCNTNNGLEVYRCSSCNVVKPYLQHKLRLSQIRKITTVKSSAPARETGHSTQAWQSSDEHQAVPVSSTTTPHHAGLPVMTQKASASNTDDQPGYAESQSLQQLHISSGPQGDQEEVLEFPDRECRLVLVGKTGNGKSTTASTIVGLEGCFKSSSQFNSVTKVCQHYSTKRFGIQLEVVDTPGVIDTQMDAQTEIIKCLGLTAPGPHAILITLRIGVRFTDEENKAVEEVHRMFGSSLFHFLVIVFTHGDQLKNCSEAQKEIKFRYVLENAPQKLKELMDKANHRYVVFDNTASKDSKNEQVKELLTTVTKLVRGNGGKPYTNNTLQQVEYCMQEREGELKKQQESQKKRASSLHFRQMARDEIVKEEPLLKRIKKIVLPILLTLGKIIAVILAAVL